LKEEVGYESLYRTFLEFEEYTYKAEEQKYSEFLMEWQQRQTSASEGGLTYPNLILAFKLLRNSCLGLEAHLSVFAELRACENSSVDFLAKTLNCLNGIMFDGSDLVPVAEMIEDASVDGLKYENTSNNDDISEHMNYEDLEVECETENFKEKEKTKAKNSEKKKAEKVPLLCDQCDKRFSVPSKLKHHIRSIHEKDTVCCEKCGKKIRNLTEAIKKHMATHGERKYVCPWDGCGKSFLLNNILQRHIVVHTGDKNFECDKCGKCFGRQKGLARHMDRHNGVKRAECKECHKKFFDNDKLKVHMRIHSGERPYHCEVCEHSFVQRKDLKQHMQKLHCHSKTTDKQ